VTGWAADLVAQSHGEFVNALFSDEARLWPLGTRLEFGPATGAVMVPRRLLPWWAVSEFLPDERQIEDIIRERMAADTARNIDDVLLGGEPLRKHARRRAKR
jgi:hypothetical protein